MRLHLVTTHRALRGPPQALREEGWPHTLLSYAHADAERFLQQAWTKDSCILIDSGAFTAWSAGTVLRPEAYAEWAQLFRLRWSRHVREVEFMTLDVIGDQVATWRNFRALRLLDLPVIPIVTYNVDLAHIDRALEEGPRLALGGLVPLAQRRKELGAWLDACFSRVMRYAAHRQRMPRVHLLGISQRWVLERYPCASADSSAWSYLVRNGQWSGPGGMPARLPPIGRHPEINTFALRCKIREASDLCAQVTAMWRARDVEFDD